MSMQDVSTEGLAKMDRDLERLRKVVKRRPVRRRFMRATMMTIPMVTLAALIVLENRPIAPNAHSPIAEATTPVEASMPPPPEPTVEAVRIASSPMTTIQYVSDREIQDALREAGQPPGLIRIGGRTVWQGDMASQ